MSYISFPCKAATNSFSQAPRVNNGRAHASSLVKWQSDPEGSPGGRIVLSCV